jgi:sphingolipid delta-4 desaturase
MLSKYGDQIKELYGPDQNLKYIVVAMVFVQLLSAYLLREASWFTIFVLAYVWGGTINHSLTLAVHELSHNLGFKTPTKIGGYKVNLNTYFGMFASLPHAVPTFVTFRKYHLIHHRYQGVDQVDPDLPTAFEGRHVNSAIVKFLFLFFQPFVYSFRPMIMFPGDISFDEVVGYAFQLTFDFIFFQFVGAKGLAYLFLGLVLGSGLHPLAAHFIAEHYVWSNKKSQEGEPIETYSYYGPLNYFTFFVGYHNEHHDFPQITGRKLYKLHQIAPEYYKIIRQEAHTSWIGCMIRFVVDNTITPFSRVVRPKPDETKKQSGNKK